MADSSDPIAIDQEFIAEFRRLKNKIDNMQGTGVTVNLPDVLVIDGSPPSDPPATSDADDPGFLPVTCVTNSATVGTDYGNATTRATLKYDVTLIGASGTIGANLAPDWTPARMVKNKVAAGAIGAIYYSGATVKLWTVNEYADDQENCP